MALVYCLFANFTLLYLVLKLCRRMRFSWMPTRDEKRRTVEEIFVPHRKLLSGIWMEGLDNSKRNLGQVITYVDAIRTACKKASRTRCR
jgi:hypothetical protein